MDINAVNQALFDFLDHSPNSFFAVRSMAERLEAHGFRRLLEGDSWTLAPGDRCYVTRNGSSIIAFQIPTGEWTGFQILASHSDSPAFKLKSNPEIRAEGSYLRLNVERYGGMILSTWFDRPLSLAGRVLVRTENGIESRLVNLDRDLLVIPSLAIHMDRTVNDGYKFNPQTDLLPLLGCGKGEGESLFGLIAEEAGASPEDLLDADLFLYNRMKATCLGLNRELIASGRLDDLQCAFASLTGFLEARPKGAVAVHCVFDNEEVGSGTKQGAASSFLGDTLRRIGTAFGRTQEDHFRALASSYMVSADNAHGVHPNHPEKADPTNRPVLNGGIVLKYSANQKYTTDGVSGAIFRSLCQRAEAPVQTFFNRSDMLGGSTLGNISSAQVAVSCVDVGLPQLAMHSAWETAGAKDTLWLAETARELFSTCLRWTGDDRCSLE